jgi:V8-like Glu-specific endopeptidase
MSSLAMFQNELILQKEDRRQPVSPFNLRNFPYNCIGRIGVYNDQLGGIQCGTGFLISSSLILTSAHNLEALSEKAMPQDCQ